MKSEKSNKSQFRLSPTLNKSRVFILQKSELEKRWDPLYYAKNLFGFLKTTDFAIKSIRDISKYTISGFGVGREEQDLTEKGFIQIRPTNIDEFGNLKFDRNVYLVSKYLETKRFNIIQKNDILFNNTNSQELVGKTAFFDLDGTYFHSNHITRIKVNEELIRPKFLYILLNIYQKRKIFYTLCTNWNNQSGVGIDLLNSIKVIVPNFEIQDKVIFIFENSLAQKQKNEAKAEKLLSSIDDYLLKELGIKLPEPPENTLKNRMFTRTLSDILNKRIDPFFHQDKFINNLTAISNGKYPVKQIREIILGNLIKGSLPKQDEKDGECSVVQINSINADGTLALDELLTAKNIFSKQQKLKIGDVLVVITGATIGKVAFWNYEGDYFLGGDIVKFQTSSLSDNSFVYHFLRCSLMQTEIKRNITGATNGHLAPEDILHLPIPVPPLSKQKEIAEHITGIRLQAQQLKDKTNEALKQASEGIEKILLS